MSEMVEWVNTLTFPAYAFAVILFTMATQPKRIIARNNKGTWRENNAIFFKATEKEQK